MGPLHVWPDLPLTSLLSFSLLDSTPTHTLLPAAACQGRWGAPHSTSGSPSTGWLFVPLIPTAQTNRKWVMRTGGEPSPGDTGACVYTRGAGLTCDL